MTIWFDMDGTLCNLYAVENWLERLRQFDPTPYKDAAPMLRMSSLARSLNRLGRNGYRIGVISWLSKEPTPEYDEAVTAAKIHWLAQHLPSVRWDEILILPHGTPKATAANASFPDILFDDEERNIEDWETAGGWGFSPDKIMEILKNLR